MMFCRNFMQKKLKNEMEFKVQEAIQKYLSEKN